MIRKWIAWIWKDIKNDYNSIFREPPAWTNGIYHDISDEILLFLGVSFIGLGMLSSNLSIEAATASIGFGIGIFCGGLFMRRFMQNREKGWGYRYK
jgi:hypothetical protein